MKLYLGSGSIFLVLGRPILKVNKIVSWSLFPRGVLCSILFIKQTMFVLVGLIIVAKINH